jgi:hypothetical protein
MITLEVGARQRGGVRAIEEQLVVFAELHPDLLSLCREEWLNVTQMCLGTDPGDMRNHCPNRLAGL